MSIVLPHRLVGMAQKGTRFSDDGSYYLFKSELNVKPNSKHAKRHQAIEKSPEGKELGC